MAWNEGDNKDPWGNKNQQGPPDLEKIIRDFFRKLMGSTTLRGPTLVAPSRPSMPTLLGFVAAVFFALWVLAGFTIVNPSEKAAVLQFGKYTETLDSGMHWRPPFIDTIEKVNVTKIRNFTYDAQMLTQGENIVSVELVVQYTINNLQDYLFNAVDPDESLKQAAASAVRQVVGNNSLDDIITTGRTKIAAQITEQLNQTLVPYQLGVSVVDVAMQSVKPPEEVAAAFADVVKAREDAQTYQNQALAYTNSIIPAAKGEAARIGLAAGAYAQQVVNNANASVATYTALESVAEKYPAITRERMYLDALENVYTHSSKVMVDVKNSSNLLYLPLDKLVSDVKAKVAADAPVVPAAAAAPAPVQAQEN